MISCLGMALVQKNSGRTQEYDRGTPCVKSSGRQKFRFMLPWRFRCRCYVELCITSMEQPDVETYSGRRHLAILALMYDSGARVQELIDLTPESVRIEHTPYTIRLIGKGRKSRIVPLVRKQVDVLKAYMVENNLFSPERYRHPLFFNSRGEKLTRAGVVYILNKYVREAHQQNPKLVPLGISCHSLRHSKAMHLLQAGINIVYIRDILGHVSIQTTEIYARAGSMQKQDALEKAYVDILPKVAKDREWERNKDILMWLKSLQK